MSHDDLGASGWAPLLKTAGPLSEDSRERLFAALYAELHRLAGTPVTCVREDSDKESPCVTDPGVPVHVVALPGGHHFGGDYARLGRIALETVAPPR